MSGAVFASCSRKDSHVEDSFKSRAASDFGFSHDAALIAAKTARLRYVDDRKPGIVRQRAGKGFVYRDPAGAIITDNDELARINAIAVPPAWTKVWICPDPNGHIQATGRDARGRKQYRYHARWRSERDQSKFEHMLLFGRSLPSRRGKRSGLVSGDDSGTAGISLTRGFFFRVR